MLKFPHYVMLEIWGTVNLSVCRAPVRGRVHQGRGACLTVTRSMPVAF